MLTQSQQIIIEDSIEIITSSSGMGESNNGGRSSLGRELSSRRSNIDFVKEKRYHLQCQVLLMNL
jgi:hypothetical protein